VFGLLSKSSIPIPETSIDWLFNGFSWCLQNFGDESFYQNTTLVLPSDQFFPGRANNAFDMSQLIFDQVRNYCGLSYWPVELVDVHHEQPGENDMSLPAVLENTGQRLRIYMEPRQAANPEVQIANFAHILAHHLSFLAKSPPPCEEDEWFHLMELVAVFMGFGLMMANTARPYRGGGCARCVSPELERQGFLSEDELTYALAIFCTLKEIPEKSVKPYLKGSLFSVFKRSLKDIQKRTEHVIEVKQSRSENQLRQFNQVALCK